MFGTGNLDIVRSSFDKTKGDHTIGHILIRNDRTGVYIAAINIEQCELPADFFEIADGHGLAEVGIDDAADCSLIEDGVADYVDVAKHKPRTLPKRRCLR